MWAILSNQRRIKDQMLIFRSCTKISCKNINLKLSTRSRVYIYLFIWQIPKPATAGSARISAREKQVRRAQKKKGIKGQRAKFISATRAIDALIGDEEQDGKQKERGSRIPTQLPWTIWWPLTTCMDHAVALF